MLEVERPLEVLRRACRPARRSSLEVNRGELLARARAERRRQDDAALDPRRDHAGRTRGEIDRSNGEVGWVPQQAALYRRLTVEENLRLFARLEGRRGRRGRRSSGCSSRPGSPSAATIRSPRSRAATSSGSTSRSACSRDPSVLLLDEPSSGLDPRQRVRLWEFVAGLAEAGTTVIYSTHHIEEASRYGDRLVVLADGETIFDGSFGELRRAAGPRPEGHGRRLRDRLRPLPPQAGPLMRWLLLKDLQLLRRSPLVTGLLVALSDRAGAS